MLKAILDPGVGFRPIAFSGMAHSPRHPPPLDVFHGIPSPEGGF